jgi:hypothetical protein
MTPNVTREDVVEAVRSAFEREPWALACWEGGSASFGRLDRWSDVDLGVGVEDGRAADAFERIDAALRALAPVAWSWEVAPVTAPKPQRYYRLEGTDPFLVIDVGVFPAATPPQERFLGGRRHGRARVLFDRAGFTDVPEPPAEEWRERLRRRLSDLRGRFRLGASLVEKCVARGDLLEAQAFYLSYTVNPLVELLRIRHDPRRHDFGVRYVRYDLPPDVVRRLDDLAIVPDGAGLVARRRRAEAWFDGLWASADVDSLPL